MNDIMISCPKCLEPGVLDSKRSLTARIGSRHIAHVLHAWRNGNRRTGMRSRLELERIWKPLPNRMAQ